MLKSSVMLSHQPAGRRKDTGVPPFVKFLVAIALAGIGMAIYGVIITNLQVREFNVSSEDLMRINWYMLDSLQKTGQFQHQQVEAYLSQVWAGSVELPSGYSTYLKLLYGVVYQQLMLQILLVFLIPALLAMLLFGHIADLWRIRMSAKALVALLLVLVGTIPFVYWSEEAVRHWLGTQWLSIFKAQEAMRNGLLAVLLWTPSADATSLWRTLLIVAFLPAIAEELLFRGVLLKYLHELTGKVHLAVWLTAILFAAMHFSASQFVPILIMGVILGYLYVWSGTLLVPIIVHALFNSLSVVAVYMYRTGQLTMNPEDFAIPDSIGGFAFILTLIGLYLLYRWRTPFAKAG